MMNANSYAGPKHDAPCTAPTTIGPGSLTNASHAPAAFSAWSTWQIEWVWPLGPEALDLVERELRAGRDDEVVVVEHRAVAQLDAVLLRGARAWRRRR